MSHFTEVKTEIKDIEALKNALASMNLNLEHNVTCRYYEGAPIRENVAKLPGPYDIAFEKDSNDTYSISADFYQGHVEKVIGKDGVVLINNYSIEKLRLEAKKMGYKVYSSGENKLKVIDPNEPGKLEVIVNGDGTLSFKTSGFSGKRCTKFENLEKSFGAVVKYKRTAQYYETEEVKTKVKEYL